MCKTRYTIPFFRIPTIDIQVKIEVKILSIREGIRIQKTIRDRNSAFRIIPDHTIIYTTKCANP